MVVTLTQTTNPSTSTDSATTSTESSTSTTTTATATAPTVNDENREVITDDEPIPTNKKELTKFVSSLDNSLKWKEDAKQQKEVNQFLKNFQTKENKDSHYKEYRSLQDKYQKFVNSAKVTEAYIKK